MIYFADSETEVYEGQKSTRVWLIGMISEDFSEKYILTSLNEFIYVLSTLANKSILYFHNLKFDGCFIMDYLLRNGWTFGIKQDGYNFKLKKDKELNKNEFTCYISRKGQFYNIVLSFGKNRTKVTIRDSIKLLPYPLAMIGKMLNTKHQKLEMDYLGVKSEGYVPTKKELDYFESDLYVLAEGMNAIAEYGIEGTTIGRVCLNEFKKMYGRYEYSKDFPNLFDIKINEKIYGYKNVWLYIQKSYFGAFTYVNPEKQGKIIKNGFTLDVTSLYPSRMHSSSGVEYPFGMPKMGKGRCEIKNGRYFFQRIKTRFKIKEGYLPFIKKRDSYLFNHKECLTSSDVILKDGSMIEKPIVITLTQTELSLFFEHYQIITIEYLDYAVFLARKGMFDQYINKWKRKKDNAKGNTVLRQSSKFMLNNLYGKFASSYLSSFKIPYIDEEKNILRFVEQYEEEATPGYIAVGSAIISEARVFQVRHCQKNYHVGGNGFCYSDTDSIHFEGTIEELYDTPISENELNTYKIEGFWHTGIFQQVKRYLEISEEGLEVTCAGMPQRVKDIYKKACGYMEEPIKGSISWEEYLYIRDGKRVEDFKKGLIVPGKYKTVRYPGGIVLEPGDFTFR